MDRLSYYASRGTPFLFIIDYKKKNIIVEPLERLPNKILFKTPLLRNYIPPYKKYPKITRKEPISFKRYETAFNEVIEEIKRGNTYLLNLTFPTPITVDASLLEIFYSTKAKFKLFYKDQFICFSPERFVSIYGNTIKTYPMKGTIDASIPNAKVKILNDEKEMAEHTMVVDLLRNDLGTIATKIRVKRFRYIDTITADNKKLLQVSSEIEGVLPRDWKNNLGQIFATILPAGSITGTPKRSTCAIIDRVEGYERGFYTGVFGVFDGHNLESGVMIRFIEQTSSGLVYKSGGGITIDSQADKEYKELIDKIYLPI